MKKVQPKAGPFIVHDKAGLLKFMTIEEACPFILFVTNKFLIALTMFVK